MTNRIFKAFAVLLAFLVAFFLLLLLPSSSGTESKSLSFTFEELRSTALIDSLLALEEYRTPEGSELVFGLKYGMTSSEVYSHLQDLEARTGGSVYHWDVDDLAAIGEIRGLVEGSTFRADFVDESGKSYRASYFLSPRYEENRLVEIRMYYKGDVGLKLQQAFKNRQFQSNPVWLDELLGSEFAKSQEDIDRFSWLLSDRGHLDSNSVCLPNLRSQSEGRHLDVIPVREILLEYRKKAEEYEAAKARSTEDIF
jgi:hypothetical protein